MHFVRVHEVGLAAIVVALSTGVLKVKGTPYTFRQGERIRADHPLVRKHPELFAADGLSDAELGQARQDWLNSRNAA